MSAVQTNAAASVSDTLAISALLDWWRLAGVDTCVEELPVDWTASAARKSAPAALSAPAANALPAAGIWPDRLDAFEAWLANGTNMPESAWTGAIVAPSGVCTPRVMIILDVPADQPSALLEADAARLVEAMLRAVGLTHADTYSASLAIRRPPGGRLPAESIGMLVERMRHHIGLVSPDRLLIMGDETKRALLPTNAGGQGEYLQSVNHGKGTVNAVAIFHPQLILKQAAAKAECWRALQSLFGGQ